MARIAQLSIQVCQSLLSIEKVGDERIESVRRRLRRRHDVSSGGKVRIDALAVALHHLAIVLILVLDREFCPGLCALMLLALPLLFCDLFLGS